MEAIAYLKFYSPVIVRGKLNHRGGMLNSFVRPLISNVICNN